MYPQQRIHRKTRSHSSNTAVEASLFRQRPFTNEDDQDTAQIQDHNETPDVQNKLEQATHLGHNFGRVKVQDSAPAVIQPKLAIGAPGDKYEQEADSVASQVMSMNAPASQPSIQRQGTEPEEEELQMKPLASMITPLVQRQTEPTEEELQTKRSPQESEASPNDASGDLEHQLNSSKGGGSPLPDEVRSFMEPRFGADFSQVRVHTDTQAVQMNQAVGAQAFTHGSDIYFGAGKSPAISDLTAHELTHVVQQTGSQRIQCKVGEIAEQPVNITASHHRIMRRQPGGNAHVGGEPGNMTFLDDERGNVVGPGEAGFTHRMLAQVGSETEGLMEQGLYADARLRHVLPSLEYLDGQIVARGKTKSRYEGKVRGDDAIFAPWGIAKEMYEEAVKWCDGHIHKMEQHRTEETLKADQYNAWVSRANSFFTSLTRLEAMQNMLGVRDPRAMASALMSGLREAGDVAARAKDAYVGGNQDASLAIPPSDNTVTVLSNQTTLAAQEMNTAYLGFQRNLLALRRDSIHAEGETDRQRLQKIEETKQFVRNVGKTIDVTASVVSGAPSTLTNVTNAVRHGEAWVSATRNRRQIMAGQRPTHNPTYLATNEEGNMVVRNVQTGMDRPAEGGEATPSPAGPSLSMPSSVSDVLGQIADFAYASEVREINARLEQIKTRCDAVEGVRELLAVRQAAEEYQNKLNQFAHKCNELQERITQRRTAYWQLGVDLDNFARQDRESRQSGQAPGRGEERYATIMTAVGQIREVLVTGNGAKTGIFSPSEFENWAQGIEAERSARPPRTDIPIFKTGEEEWSRLSRIHNQVETFGENVHLLNEIFSGVESEAGVLMRGIQVGGGTGVH